MSNTNNAGGSKDIPDNFPAEKVSQVLAGDAIGVILNPMGINLPLAVNRPPKQENRQ